MTLWDEEANLTDYPHLVRFSLSMPIWLAGTYLVCVYHAYTHVRVVRAKQHRWGKHPHRDHTLTVLGLPLVYGLMAFKAVTHVWQVVVDHPLGLADYNTWQDRRTFYFEMYESCFSVGDVYEAIALYIFGDICLAIIQNKVKDESWQVENAMRTFAIADEDFLAARASSRKSISKTHTALAKSLHKLTIIGIRYFCISCILQAMYQLTTVGCRYVGHPLPITGVQDNQVGFVLYGMGLMSSFAAIENVIVVEFAFGHSFLELFSPNRKFWSAKVLVSLSFMQKMLFALPPFSRWSTLRQNLLYSSLICFECFFISLFHMKAWGYSEAWYDEEEEQHGHPPMKRVTFLSSNPNSRSDTAVSLELKEPCLGLDVLKSRSLTET